MKQCLQAIVVTSPGWDSSLATVRRYERSAPGAAWKEAAPPCDAVTGRNGMAWGIGLHPPQPGTAKHEGDGRAPAGVFRLHEIFGYDAPSAAHVTKFPYVQITASSFGVDDPSSRYYNRVVNASCIPARDWNSAENMLLKSGTYRRGIVVEHNWEKPLPGRGSCIFLHIWPGPGRGTSGCIAMAEQDLAAIIRWLDESMHPVLIQLPAPEYARLKDEWQLP